MPAVKRDATNGGTTRRSGSSRPAVRGPADGPVAHVEGSFQRIPSELWRGLERRGSPRPISGGSDAALLTTMLASASLCLDCLANKTGVARPRIDALLATIGATLKLAVGPGRCDACQERKTVVSLDTTAGPTATARTAEGTERPRTAAGELWRFLEAHRGEMFCTQCLTRALGGTGRLDRAVIAAEGRGAQRRHAACSSCGKPRLVCGLVAR